MEDVKHVRPAVEKTRPNVAKNPDVDRLEEDVNRMAKRWGNCCMQVKVHLTFQLSNLQMKEDISLFNLNLNLGCRKTEILRGCLRVA